jgi:hypothetical protein
MIHMESNEVKMVSMTLLMRMANMVNAGKLGWADIAHMKDVDTSNLLNQKMSVEGKEAHDNCSW